MTRILDKAVPDESLKERLRRRLEAEGRLVVRPAGGPSPGRDAVIEELPGASDAVLEAIAAGRAPR